jgi:hypothetical protein
MKYTVHAGHAAKGHLFTGASGYCEESVVDRFIKDSVIKWLKIDGNLVSDCTVDSGLSQSNIISKIKKKINAEQNVTVNTSIHLNANKKSKADGKTKGVECYVYDTQTVSGDIGNRIAANVSRLGFKNRGVKARKDLGVLKGITNKGANVLVECFFCDDQDDYNLYAKIGADPIGRAIAEGIVGHEIQPYIKPSGKFVYQGVDYSPVFNAAYYAVHNPDVVKSLGNNESKLFEHFCIYGMKERRQACADFNVNIYKERYTDLQSVFGTNYPEYYKHYCQFGIKEGRKAI